MTDKRTFTAFLLIFLVIMTYQFLILPQVAPPPAPEPPATTVPSGEETAAPAVPPPPAPLEELPAPEAEPWTSEAVGAAEAREFVVETSLYRAVLDTTRGGLKSWQTSEYLYPAKSGEMEGKPVELVGDKSQVAGRTISTGLNRIFRRRRKPERCARTTGSGWRREPTWLQR